MASLSFMTKALSGHPSNRVIESLSNQNSLPTKEVVEEANSKEIPPAWVAEYSSFAKDETTKSTSGALSRSVLLFCFIAGLIGLIISSLQIYEGEACFPLKDTTKCEPFTSKILGNSGPNVYTTVFRSSAGIPYLSEEEIIIFKGINSIIHSILHEMLMNFYNRRMAQDSISSSSN
jgi:hypothetical protein